MCKDMDGSLQFVEFHENVMPSVFKTLYEYPGTYFNPQHFQCMVLLLSPANINQVLELQINANAKWLKNLEVVMAIGTLLKENYEFGVSKLRLRVLDANNSWNMQQPEYLSEPLQSSGYNTQDFMQRTEEKIFNNTSQIAIFDPEHFKINQLVFNCVTGQCIDREFLSSPKSNPKQFFVHAKQKGGIVLACPNRMRIVAHLINHQQIEEQTLIVTNQQFVSQWQMLLHQKGIASVKWIPGREMSVQPSVVLITHEMLASVDYKRFRRRFWKLLDLKLKQRHYKMFSGQFLQLNTMSLSEKRQMLSALHASKDLCVEDTPITELFWHRVIFDDMTQPQIYRWNCRIFWGFVWEEDTYYHVASGPRAVHPNTIIQHCFDIDTSTIKTFRMPKNDSRHQDMTGNATIRQLLNHCIHSNAQPILLEQYISSPLDGIKIDDDKLDSHNVEKRLRASINQLLSPTDELLQALDHQTFSSDKHWPTFDICHDRAIEIHTQEVNQVPENTQIIVSAFTNTQYATKTIEEIRRKEATCTVCMEAADTYIMLHCGHILCVSCHQQCCMTRNTCPSCTTMPLFSLLGVMQGIRLRNAPVPMLLLTRHTILLEKVFLLIQQPRIALITDAPEVCKLLQHKLKNYIYIANHWSLSQPHTHNTAPIFDLTAPFVHFPNCQKINIVYLITTTSPTQLSTYKQIHLRRLCVQFQRPIVMYIHY